MAKYIDSTIVEYNEDGTQTITTVEHWTPPTKAQKATGLALLGSVFLLPVVPVVFQLASEKMEERRAARQKEETEALKIVD